MFDCPICGGWSRNHRPGCPAFDGAGVYAGTATATVVEVAVAEERRCSYCGVTVLVDNSCSQCGAPLFGGK